MNLTLASMGFHPGNGRGIIHIFLEYSTVISMFFGNSMVVHYLVNPIGSAQQILTLRCNGKRAVVVFGQAIANLMIKKASCVTLTCFADKDMRK